MTRLSLAAGLAAGFVADRVLGDPQRFHPVAGFGRVAAALEVRLYSPTRVRGAAYAGLLTGTTVASGLLLDRASRRNPLLHGALAAATTWAVLGGTSLEREARAVSDLLAEDRLVDARQRLTHLVGRDTSELDEGEIVRAVVESVAENTSDAVVAPLLLGGVLGVPGLLGYRAANTLDAMVGHRSERYLRFGWAAARLDDLLNLPGARLTALLVVLLGPEPSQALATWRRDAAGHPSPNAGPVEASFAGALGVRLGGTNRYGSLTEHRHVLGSGRAPVRKDIDRAVALARRVDRTSLVVAVVLAGARR
jgi:adenosylcobinamide-phosphate synthase